MARNEITKAKTASADRAPRASAGARPTHLALPLGSRAKLRAYLRRKEQTRAS